eukprot:5953400-Amphidinium_carterae.1
MERSQFHFMGFEISHLKSLLVIWSALDCVTLLSQPFSNEPFAMGKDQQSSPAIAKRLNRAATLTNASHFKEPPALTGAEEPHHQPYDYLHLNLPYFPR